MVYTFDGISEIALHELQNLLEDIMFHCETAPAWVGEMHLALIVDAERKEAVAKPERDDIPF